MSENLFEEIVRNVLDGLDHLISEPLWTPDERSRVAFYLANKALEKIPDILDDALINPLRRKLRFRKNLDNMYYSLDLKKRNDYVSTRNSSDNGRSICISTSLCDSNFVNILDGKIYHNICKIIGKNGVYNVNETIRIAMKRTEGSRNDLGDSILECVGTYDDIIPLNDDDKDLTQKSEVIYTVLRATGVFSGVRAISIKYLLDKSGRRNRLIEFLYE